MKKIVLFLALVQGVQNSAFAQNWFKHTLCKACQERECEKSGWDKVDELEKRIDNYKNTTRSKDTIYIHDPQFVLLYNDCSNRLRELTRISNSTLENNRINNANYTLSINSLTNQLILNAIYNLKLSIY